MHGIKRLRHVAYLKNIIAARHWTPPANDPVELIDFRLIETTRQAELVALARALGVVHTEGQTRAEGRVRLVASDGAGLEVRVEDQGPGVRPELRQRVFEPFFTTRAARPGGLGLAISRRLVESAGGALDVVDAEGGGAAFRLRFGAS